MASAITHFIVGASLAWPALRSKSVRRVMPGWAIPVSAGLLAVAPDLDTYAARAFEVPRQTLFAHRGFFHSAAFLTCASGVLAAVACRRPPFLSWIWLTLIWSIAAITHPLLDMLTDGGTGVMLLYPLSERRYFFPWRPIHVSPLSIMRFFSRAGYILKSEALFCAAALGIGWIGWMLRRR
jgi:inner membrane protein